MKKSAKLKWAAAAGAASAAALYQAARRIKNIHHELTSQAGEALLEKTRAARKMGEAVEADNVWNAYPRPQMRRDGFLSLNGRWRLNGQEILVPFPPQAKLSGCQGKVGTRLEYSRIFTLPEEWNLLFEQESTVWQGAHSRRTQASFREGKRVLLHFGAVDQVAEVYINGWYAGGHEGGYLPFTLDITEQLRKGDNLLVVKARDTLSPRYPYGKQRKARGGMWYTPVSGIWQSVWLEWVPEEYIQKLDVTTDLKKVKVSVKGCFPNKTHAAGKGREMGLPVTVTIALHDGNQYTVQGEGCEVEIDLTQIRLPDGRLYQPILWTTKQPYLYQMTVAFGEDRVSSYFGLRTIKIRQVEGVPRVCLNGKPIFLNGVLDQGYFCDGIYLPAEEAEYERDVLRMKELGMNLLRKHIKIEPECFYYYCDKHGMLVMQDMVNSGMYSWIRDTALPTLGVFRNWDGRLLGSRRRKGFFIEHSMETIRHLRSHPCVVAYTIFNEGWGQFTSDALYRMAKQEDDTRLYDATSGWFVQESSDFDSQHIYFHSLKLPEEPKRPVLVSECGGYSYGVPGHIYAKFAHYGYGKCKDGQELMRRIGKLYEDTILPAVEKGLCGCIYTQLSDVEDEVNGFYTYDRKVCKVDKEEMRRIAARVRMK